MSPNEKDFSVTLIPVGLVFSFTDDRRQQTLLDFFLHKVAHWTSFFFPLTENSSVKSVVVFLPAVLLFWIAADANAQLCRCSHNTVRGMFTNAFFLKACYTFDFGILARGLAWTHSNEFL